MGLTVKGTARPAHYQVIRNDLRLNADAVATLVHSFHYAWSRATKGISYATPAFAADAALNYANACKWLVYADANPPAQQQNQTIQQYRDQCFRWAMHLPANASWNQAGRWGPWQENLDLVMMYT